MAEEDGSVGGVVVDVAPAVQVLEVRAFAAAEADARIAPAPAGVHAAGDDLARGFQQRGGCCHASSRRELVIGSLYQRTPHAASAPRSSASVTSSAMTVSPRSRGRTQRRLPARISLTFSVAATIASACTVTGSASAVT